MPHRPPASLPFPTSRSAAFALSATTAMLLFAAPPLSAQARPAAPAGAPARPAPAAPPRAGVTPGGEVTVIANDYFYEAPNPIAGGVVTFRLVNKGTDYHNIWIVKIDEGYAFSDFMRALGPGRPVPGWLTGLGGPESPEPGQEVKLTMELPPGRYAVACLLPARDGMTHMGKGMFLPLTVTKGTARKAPVGDVAVRIGRDAITAPATVSAGAHLLHVYSEAPTMRGFRVGLLAQGKTPDDAAKWVAGGQQGPAPFTAIGGSTPMAQGATVWMPVTFRPGNYVLMPVTIDGPTGELRYEGKAAASIAVQ